MKFILILHWQLFTLRRNVQSPASSGLWNLFPHPGLIFFTVILWVTPTLTLDRWLLATVLSWYIYIPQRVTREDYKYFCKCYSYVTEYEEQQVSYWWNMHNVTGLTLVMFRRTCMGIVFIFLDHYCSWYDVFCYILSIVTIKEYFVMSIY